MKKNRRGDFSMKVILINGSPRKNGCTYTALSELAARLERNGVDTELVHIGAGPIQGCAACLRCLQGEHWCGFDGDAVNETIAKVRAADGLVLGSPVYCGSVTGSMTAFLNRLFHAGNMGGAYAYKVGASVVSTRRSGATTTLDVLNRYFAVSNMIEISGQGVVHGNTPEEVKADLEGMQVMRQTADKMAWVLKCLQAGREAGLAQPVPEPKVRTSFFK